MGLSTYFFRGAVGLNNTTSPSLTENLELNQGGFLDLNQGGELELNE